MPTVTAQKKWSKIATLVSGVEDNQNDQKKLEIAIKNQRVAFGHVVAGSSNGTTGGMDGVDRWGTFADIPDFTTRPWIVITQPGSGAQDLIMYGNAGESDWGFAHSPGGLFTGGSASANPTAPDSPVHADGTFSLYFNSWHGRGAGALASPFICHLMVSDDLTCCRQVFFFDNHNYGNRFYDAIDDPSDTLIHPNYACIDKEGVGNDNNNNCGMMYQFVYGPYNGSGYFKSWGPHGAMNMYGTAESCFDGITGTHMAPWQFTKNKITNTYRNPSRSGLYETRTHADGGWHGQLFDWWWVGDSHVEGDFVFGIAGDTPLDGSRKFVIFGDLMFPWNGTVPRTT